ncbi:hypothetical protein GCM10028798_02940 [Humibacter antri]
MCDPGGLFTREAVVTDEMSEIIAFLLDRIVDDERIAGFVAADSPTEESRFCVWATPFVTDPDRLIVAIDYQRVLAECAVQRNFIETYRELDQHPSASNEAARESMEVVIRQLASVHSTRPDFLDSWSDDEEPTGGL